MIIFTGKFCIKLKKGILAGVFMIAHMGNEGKCRCLLPGLAPGAD